MAGIGGRTPVRGKSRGASVAPKASYITVEGAKALQAELERLWKVERPRITAEVEAAAAHGDRSENAEYIYGKKKLREIDRRLRFLSKRLDSLTVVESSPTQEGRIYFGAWVTLEDEDGEELIYRIVGPDETKAELGWISVESPMAAALLRKVAGDAVVVRRPSGQARFTVVDIEYAHQREARGVSL